MDEHLFGLARHRLSRVEKRRRRAWTIVRWAGMAAAVGLAMLVPTRLSTTSQRVAIVSHSGDVNGDGMVDILDAFSLARAARDGDPSVTQAEIAAATAAAVRLGGGA